MDGIQRLIDLRNSFWRGLQTSRSLARAKACPQIADTVARNEGACSAYDDAIEIMTGRRPCEDAEFAIDAVI